MEHFQPFHELRSGEQIGQTRLSQKSGTRKRRPMLTCCANGQPFLRFASKAHRPEEGSLKEDCANFRSKTMCDIDDQSREGHIKRLTAFSKEF
jgi:hypothetical protein